MKKESKFESIGLRNPANFFAEYELRERGAVESENYSGNLILDGRSYEPRGDYYVYIGDLG